jgi:hypothetical protein
MEEIRIDPIGLSVGLYLTEETMLIEEVKR